VLLPSAYNPTPKRRTITADQNDHQDKPVNGEKIPNLRNNTVTEIEIANRIRTYAVGRKAFGLDVVI
jgi:hypothetical protein